ncbi:PPE2 phosphatase, partial [Probosciger aterrimus]|nr:PPE2 phosphatase [Probosciger aterrimus]
AFKAAVLIQQWYRRYVARLEMRRRCTWRIFQSIEYACEQDQIKLHNFFSYLMDHFTPSSSKERDFITRMFISGESFKEAELEKYCDYESIEVPDSYTGPRLSFPLSPDHATALLEAFKQKQQLHARYVLNLLHETRKHLKQLPNISHVSTCYSEEVTVCGRSGGGVLRSLWGGSLAWKGQMLVCTARQLVLSKIFRFTLKCFNVSCCKDEPGGWRERVCVLAHFLLGLEQEGDRVHGKKILKMIQNVFCWLPLATLIDQKVLIIHGGISDTTDLDVLEKIQRNKFISVLRGKKRKKSNRNVEIQETNEESKAEADPAGNEAAPSLPPSPQPAQAPSTANRLEFSRWVRQTVQEQIEWCRRLVDISESEEEELTYASVVSLPDLDGPCQTLQEDWKQILDILWSDPMPQEGCIANTVRGGGCYFGPDVTRQILEKYNLQFLIRSHECKQEGYEFCHNRKVLTIFSASNYYEIGSNRGAYVKLGPDLVPHFVQYQANKAAHTLTMTQRQISRVEESAFRALREKLFAHTSALISAFKAYDADNTGRITLSNWATAVESVLHLGLPWRMLRPQLVRSTADGMLEYKSWLDDLAMERRSQEHIQTSLLEVIYRNRSNLETIFRIIDRDHSGLISFEEFHQTWKLFSSHMNIELTDDGINDLVRSIDFNKDGNIDFNEFLEAFRLVKQSQ